MGREVADSGRASIEIVAHGFRDVDGAPVCGSATLNAHRLGRAKQSGKGAPGAVQRALVLSASEELEEGRCSAAEQCV